MACLVCRGVDDEGLLLWCSVEGCRRGRHTFCCTPKLTERPSGHWFCPGCLPPGHGPRGVPESIPKLKARIDRAVFAASSGKTRLADREMFKTFSRWYSETYEVEAGVTFLVAEQSGEMATHQVEAVGGFLTSLRDIECAKSKDPHATRLVLLREFSLNGWVETPLKSKLIINMIQGLMTKNPRQQEPVKIGVSFDMIQRACMDVTGTDVMRRMLGLASIWAYCLGSRNSEVSATSELVIGDVSEDTGEPMIVDSYNRHTILRREISGVYGEGQVYEFGGVDTSGSSATAAANQTLQRLVLEDNWQELRILVHSTKTRKLRVSSRSVTLVRGVGSQEGYHIETDLQNLLIREIPRWCLHANQLSDDPLFSLRRSSQGRPFRLKTLRGDQWAGYVKELALEQGFEPKHFSAKSWKKSTVTHGVSQGESREQIKARGDHVTWRRALITRLHPPRQTHLPVSA